MEKRDKTMNWAVHALPKNDYRDLRVIAAMNDLRGNKQILEFLLKFYKENNNE